MGGRPCPQMIASAPRTVALDPPRGAIQRRAASSSEAKSRAPSSIERMCAIRPRSCGASCFGPVAARVSAFSNHARPSLARSAHARSVSQSGANPFLLSNGMAWTPRRAPRVRSRCYVPRSGGRRAYFGCRPPDLALPVDTAQADRQRCSQRTRFGTATGAAG